MRRVFIEAGRTGLLDDVVLSGVQALGRQFKGRKQLSELIQIWHPESGRTRSVLEGEFMFLCQKYRIQAPLVNRRVKGIEVDFLWPDRKLIVEVDGKAFHSDNFAFERDGERHNILAGSGYMILRFTYRKVFDEPSEVARQIKNRLDRS